MSGLLEEVSTPCPSRIGTSRVNRSSNGSDSLRSMWEDSLDSFGDTGNVEFTTEIRAPVLTGSKPRRRTKTCSSFAVHDDEESHVQTASKRKRENGPAVAASNQKTSLLAQPAQRFQPKVSFASSSPAKPPRPHGESIRKTQTRNVNVERNKELLMQINGAPEGMQTEDLLKKDIRRNTVYIPPDETTVASVFMGMFSPLKSEHLEHQSSENTINSLESQIARKLQAKKSLVSSTQKAPLRPSLRVAQESCIHVDVAGKNGGKENIPPGTLLGDGKDKSSQLTITGDIHDNNVKTNQQTACRETRVPENQAAKPLVAKSANGSLQRAIQNVKRTSVNASLNKYNVKQKISTRNGTLLEHKRSTLSSSLNHYSTSRATAPRPSTRSLDYEYPLIQEDIINPALYDENWLSNQEVVITQLVNELFDNAVKESAFNNPDAFRQRFLTLYQDPLFAHLHKRVQASLSYGALSIPRDLLAQTNRFRRDVGMKKKFYDFWVETYDLRVLRAALETITGRRIPNPKVMQESNGGFPDSSKERALKRKLESFLDTFLLKNQDMDRRHTQESDADMAGKAYQRTVLRSIMIIILLDRAAMSSGTMLPCLFLSSSPYKSSNAVLQALARFLLPSSGDIIKALGHFNCQLYYEQHPLQEYRYRVNNIAVDLRDGVRLTRIVELLLFPAESRLDNTNPDKHQWPLSQHLKFPCLSRAVKMFNVQIALDTLASTKNSIRLISNVRADDIVNGHREKTIALLWELVSKQGLVGLINWDDLISEIDRLKLKANRQFGYEQVKDQDWFKGVKLDTLETSERHALLLKQWASILAQLKGLHLENLSTSFADGKIYQSIVDEYEESILATDRETPTDERSSSCLQSRFRALGCSPQFGEYC
ncbi:hypothetical protein EYZ11_010535 [Aspergillus tanneri]|uniref:Calponin-homology (CH) domain-containing protein n=1 Tax=Aspergillus tanneri TaxID=1220188 RepID=A0A4S3J528_9EURO|nr:hypothetical protein EYZ11_010535 [Aspergillus tanneri]